jgi:hypothetical protein
MRTAASARDTSAFVLERMTAGSRLRREHDDIVRTARAAYDAAGGQAGRSGGGEGEWVHNAHRATWIREDCVVKVARSSYGVEALRRDLEARARIHVQPAWSAWRQLVPRTLSEHATGGRLAVVEERLPGMPLTDLMDDPSVMARVRGRLGELREATYHNVIADDMVPTWFLDPGATVAALLRRHGHRRAAAAVAEWADDAAGSLRGSTCRVSLVHGDLWPGNVLLGARGRLGVIDWDQASFHDAPLHDALHLTFHPVRSERRVDLGLLIRRLLMGRDDDPDLAAAVARSGLGSLLPPTGMTERDALVWYWLRHVDRMTREPGHATNPRWISNNVVAVATTIHQGRRTT